MKEFQWTSGIMIVSAVFACGCDQSNRAGSADARSGGETVSSGRHVHADGSTHDPADDGSHTHQAGPHGGVVTDWGGGKFHVEIAFDRSKKEATVHILGDDERTAVPIDATEVQISVSDPQFQFSLTATPQTGDPSGKASRFVGSHDKLGEISEIAGAITGVVEDTPYSGSFHAELQPGD